MMAMTTMTTSGASTTEAKLPGLGQLTLWKSTCTNKTKVV